jgi:hypothetical protein
MEPSPGGVERDEASRAIKASILGAILGLVLSILARRRSPP